MLVYRLEDDEGFGPFSSTKFWPDKQPDKNLHSIFSCTVVGIRTAQDKEAWRFGCKSKDDIERYWGKETLKEFLKEGWIIATYKVHKNHVRFGSENFELAFKIDKAERQ